MTAILSVDVDDLAFAVRDSHGIPVPDAYQSCVPAAVDATLLLLADTGSRATFFVQGWVCRTWPELVRCIYAAGHSIASHGMTHELVSRLSRPAFISSLRDSKRLLEDLIGTAVLGYRSPSFSSVRVIETAMHLIRDAGYTYSSSAHFGRTAFGEIPGRVAPLRIRLSNGLVECPISTVFAGGRGVSIGSSFYCRRLPTAVHRRLLAGAEHAAGGVHVYFHPFELAAEPVAWRRRLAHPCLLVYAGSRHRGADRLRSMITSRRYVPIESLLMDSSQATPGGAPTLR